MLHRWGVGEFLTGRQRANGFGLWSLRFIQFSKDHFYTLALCEFLRIFL